MYVPRYKLLRLAVPGILQLLLLISQEKSYVYIVKSKSEVFEKFIEYKNRVENELNKKI